MKFLKTVHQEERFKATYYIPVEPSNIMYFTHIIAQRIVQEGEEQVTKEDEFVNVAFGAVIEQPYPVNLKAMRKIKQTKAEEFFVLEDVKTANQPMMQKIDNKEEIEVLLEKLESNLF